MIPNPIATCTSATASRFTSAMRVRSWVFPSSTPIRSLRSTSTSRVAPTTSPAVVTRSASWADRRPATSRSLRTDASVRCSSVGDTAISATSPRCPWTGPDSPGSVVLRCPPIIGQVYDQPSDIHSVS